MYTDSRSQDGMYNIFNYVFVVCINNETKLNNYVYILKLTRNSIIHFACHSYLLSRWSCNCNIFCVSFFITNFLWLEYHYHHLRREIEIICSWRMRICIIGLSFKIYLCNSENMYVRDYFSLVVVESYWLRYAAKNFELWFLF